LIPFSKPARFDSELEYLSEASLQGRPWGGGEFYQLAKEKLNTIHPSQEILITQSCTAALELAAIALNVGPGDEVIVPSYTFVSSANAFALRGAKIVFADSDQKTMNVDLNHVEKLITKNTKVLVVVHYGGVACDMERAIELSKRHGFYIVEDAAQAIGATYNGQPLGTLGHLGALSFHGTKNVSCGEGGALLVNTDEFAVLELAKTAHEKGTDRAKFVSGRVDKYTWRSLGGSFIPSEFTSAVLLAQLENVECIHERRSSYIAQYLKGLAGRLNPNVSWLRQDIEGSNNHMFALILESKQQRDLLREFLLQRGVTSTSHYEPLHLSPFAREHFPQTESLQVAFEFSSRLLRLPVWSEVGLEVSFVIQGVLDYFQAKRSKA